MKIAFDGRGINLYRGTGIGTYSENLLKNLIHLSSEHQYEIYWRGKGYEPFQASNSDILITSRGQHSFFEKYFIPKHISSYKVDLFHAPQNGIGYTSDLDCKLLVTIHDIIPYTMPETSGRGYHKKFLSEIPAIVENASGIITVSEFSKSDIMRFFSIDPNKIFVTPLAADEKYKPLDKKYCKQYLSENYGIKTPFILYLGGFSKRKNVELLVQAFLSLSKPICKNLSLVLIGEIRDVFLRDELTRQGVVLPGFVPEEQLPIFYNASECFVYPSLYEGFGLPVLEAMSCGTNVIASDSTSIPEVAGNGCLLFNPHSVDSLISALERILEDKEFNISLCKAALDQSKSFSWKKTSEKTLQVYNQLNKD